MPETSLITRMIHNSSENSQPRSDHCKARTQGELSAIANGASHRVPTQIQYLRTQCACVFSAGKPMYGQSREGALDL